MIEVNESLAKRIVQYLRGSDLSVDTTLKVVNEVAALDPKLVESLMDDVFAALGLIYLDEYPATLPMALRQLLFVTDSKLLSLPHNLMTSERRSLTGFQDYLRSQLPEIRRTAKTAEFEAVQDPRLS